MKILTIHNFHRKGSASGDDQVYRNEADLLEEKGHDVIRYVISNDEFDHMGIWEKIRSTLGMLWSFKHYRAVKHLIEREKPEIVHVHTFFPLLSPSILYAAKRCGCKVVATLHDTRFICPCATSLRKAEICNQCGDGHYFRMFKYGCFKKSRFQSLIVAFIFKYHRLRRSFYRQIDQYICLNENQIELLSSIGFDTGKVVKKYNFVQDRSIKRRQEKQVNIPERYVVFYGRIGEEKGIYVLMKIWEQLPDIPLVVMGSGPLQNEFEEWARDKKQVYYLGYIDHEECLEIVAQGEFVVFPSIWYEGCSMVEIEAESLGKALVATDLGFSSEAIEDGVNGYKIPYCDIDVFIKRIKELWKHPEFCTEMGNRARMDYESKYLKEDNYQQLMQIYEKLK